MPISIKKLKELADERGYPNDTQTVKISDYSHPFGAEERNQSLEINYSSQGKEWIGFSFNTDNREKLEYAKKEQPKIESFKLNSVTVLPQCDRAHLLVLSEAWHPDWRVEFSGKISQTIPVNVWMRGAIIPANTSAVTFSFKSKSLMYGVLLSLLSGLIFCALLFKSRKNPK